ncbi:hypothetical protein IV203_006045 [Nitzschia inconspicua]|uniref:Plastid lipid-associated protein/fibrillin conserved domain-containing protein n=1 Tax=Nitzschia inconspicua TaxID=303405 RepID=A0A9K3PHI1_9STRA|nr:hypothetical protein IV203_006045 [Nitzschia inconspicua]
MFLARPTFLRFLCVVLVVVIYVVESYAAVTEAFRICSVGESSRPKRPGMPATLSHVALTAVPIDGYDDAFRIIDECAVKGEPSEQLFDAVRLIDKKALKIYPDEGHKQTLWDTAHGSWKLQLATGGGQKTTFKSIPIFAFAVIDEMNFGNGVGINADTIFLSLLGPHIFNTQRRQMTITITDMYLGSNQVTRFVPQFVKDAMGIGKRPEDFKRAPAFTFIGASDKAPVTRP